MSRGRYVRDRYAKHFFWIIALCTVAILLLLFTCQRSTPGYHAAPSSQALQSDSGDPTPEGAESPRQLAEYLDSDPAAQTHRVIGELKQGPPITATLQPEEVHILDIHLLKNDFFDLQVHQISIDVRIYLETPGGGFEPPEKPVDHSKSHRGEEPLVWLASEAGLHRLHILPAFGVDQPGDYKAEFIDFKRPADADTQLLARAQWAYLRAVNIRRQARERKDYIEATGLYDDSEKLFRRLNKPEYQHFLPSILNNTGLLYSKLGEYEKAQQRYDACIELSRSIRSIENEASCLFNSASLEVIRGDNKTALKLFEQALEGYRTLYKNSGSGQEHIGQALDRIGSCYSILGKSDKALTFIDNALAIFEEINNRPGQAASLLQLTRLHLNLGHFREALEYSDRALELAGKTRDKWKTASAHVHRAFVLSRLGEKKEAHYQYLQGQKLFRDLGNQRWDASITAILAQYQLDAGRTDAAMHSYHQTLALYREVDDRFSEALSLERIAKVHEVLGEYDESLAYLQYSGQIFRDDDTRSVRNVAWNHYLTGRVYHQLTRFTDAENEFRQAIELASSSAHQRLVALATYRLARTLRDQGRLKGALKKIEDALERNEKMRSRVDSAYLRSSFFAEYRNNPELHVDLLVRLHELNPDDGYDRRAFQASERARARMLNESLAESRLGSAGDFELQDSSEQQLYQRLTQLNADVIESYKWMDEKAIAESTAALLQAEEERQKLEFKRRLEQAPTDASPSPEALDLLAVRALLPEQTALLEFVLGQDASYVFLVTDSSLHIHRLPAADEVVPQVLELVEDLRRPTQLLHKQQAERSYRLLQLLLPPPIHQALEAEQNLLIVPDGVLHYLNFEALRLGPATSDPYLLERWRISYIPSATTLGQLASRPRQPSRAIDLLAFGNPDYGTLENTASSPRPSHPLGRPALLPRRLEPLPESQNEVERIAKRFDGGSARVFVRGKATEERAKDTDLLTQTRYLHFATHSLLREDRPQFSGLVLTLDDDDAEDGLLQVYEILNLELAADLVVLSACDTALGKDFHGEGLVGLTQAFFYAGAPSLVASLWQVADESTAELMTNFYSYLTADEPPAEALRHAKLDMIRSGEYQQPYYWAPFVLIGQV